jgi:hypothetical protein
MSLKFLARFDARKHIIYRRTDGTWWLAGELTDLDLLRAWARLRAELVVAIDARRATSRPSTRCRCCVGAQALVTKSFAVYAPEHLLGVYSGDHMRRFIRLFRGVRSLVRRRVLSASVRVARVLGCRAHVAVPSTRPAIGPAAGH